MDRLCDLDIVDLFNCIIERELSEQSFAQIVEGFGFGDKLEPSSIRTASNYATVCCDTDFNFSSEDYSWLEQSDKVCAVRIDDKKLVVGIELDIEDSEYYLPCAAFVKLLNRVKNDECLYVFKLRTGSVFGCKRRFDNENDSSFTISRFVPYISNPYNIDESLANFMSEFVSADWDDIPEIISHSSPQETTGNQSNYDFVEYSYEYVAFLHDIAIAYGVDTNKQINQYHALYGINDEFDEDKTTRGPLITYEEAVKILAHIGRDIGTSYDILNAADQAEELARKVQYSSAAPQPIEHTEAVDRLLNQYTVDAFEDAEQMLKEIMNK